MNKLAQRDLVIVDVVAKEAGELIGRVALELERKLAGELKSLSDLIAALPLKEGPPGKDGEPGKTGPPGAGWVPKGTWTPGTPYAALDVVQHDGGAWLALRDEPGPIGEDGWQMIVSRGRAGKPGEEGKPGPAGSLSPGTRIAVEMPDGTVAEAVVL
jgi:hypothetical protein